MIPIPGYTIVQEIHVGRNTIAYRARLDHDQAPVVLKVLRTEYPTPKAIAQLKREYEITKNLDVAGIIKPYSLYW